MFDLFSLKLSLGLLTWRDVAERLFLRTLDKIGLWKPHYFMPDVLEYLKLSDTEAEKSARKARQEYQHLWQAAERKDEASYQHYWAETKHVMYFYPWRERLQTWHWIDSLAPGPRILEYGCGTANLTYWLQRRYPSNRYSVADLATAASIDFVRFRFAGKPVEILQIGLGKDGLPLQNQYDLIFCSNVLEHTVNPDEIVEHFFEHLAPGGILYLDFINHSGSLTNPPEVGAHEIVNLTPNLAEAVHRREATIDFLGDNFEVLKPIKRATPAEWVVEGWECVGLYRKPESSQ